MDIAGKVFIVTGGASGLGEGTARMLAANGAKVVIADLQADKGEALAEEMLDAVARQPVPRSTYYSIAIAFGLLIVGLAWFATVANWGAR